MAKTPEGKVKQKGRDICKELGIFFIPINASGIGRVAYPDDILCVFGHFVSVEYKRAKDEEPRENQKLRMEEIRESYGITLVVHDDNIQHFEAELLEIKEALEAGWSLPEVISWLEKQSHCYYKEPPKW